MAKLKPAKGKSARKKGRDLRGAVPCVIILISGMALLILLFYAILRQG